VFTGDIINNSISLVRMIPALIYVTMFSYNSAYKTQFFTKEKDYKTSPLKLFLL
jgi:hypothetical protein